MQTGSNPPRPLLYTYTGSLDDDDDDVGKFQGRDGLEVSPEPTGTSYLQEAQR